MSSRRIPHYGNRLDQRYVLQLNYSQIRNCKLQFVNQKKGEEILRSGSKYAVDHQTGILNIQSVSQAADRGVYTCTVRDRQGHSARRDFTVDVVGKTRNISKYIVVVYGPEGVGGGGMKTSVE